MEKESEKKVEEGIGKVERGGEQRREERREEKRESG